jgi:hypothetical protein
MAADIVGVVHMALLRRRIALGVLGILALGVAALAWTLSHESPCEPATALGPGVVTM